MSCGGRRYQDACELLTGDINAVIEGAVSEGVTQVTVSEGHANMRNVLVDRLHPAARVVRGPARWDHKPLCQVGALSREMDLGMFVGFHSRAGTPKGLLARTWAGGVVHRMRLNGREVGETAINAALLGDQGVPVALVCGGDDLAREAREDLGDIETAVVKESLGTNLAACWGPKYTGPLLRAAAVGAVRRHCDGAFAPYRFPRLVTIENDVIDDPKAARMALVPGVERRDRRSVSLEQPTATEAPSVAWRSDLRGLPQARGLAPVASRCLRGLLHPRAAPGRRDRCPTGRRPGAPRAPRGRGRLPPRPRPPPDPHRSGPRQLPRRLPPRLPRVLEARAGRPSALSSATPPNPSPSLRMRWSGWRSSTRRRRTWPQRQTAR